MKHLFKSSALIILFLSVGCGKDSPLSSLSDIFFTDFSNTWTVVKGPDLTSTFFFTSTVTDSSKGTGTLVGHESTVSSVDFNLAGSFQNLSVKINYLTTAENGGVNNGPHAGFSYAGKVDTLSKPILLRLANVSNSNDSLVLKHG
jgi:hypothetical protein